MRSLIFTFAFISTNALAWGPTGHRAVAQVAERYLDSGAMLKAYTILGNKSLPRVATWADEIKSEPAQYSHTYNWHYTDWPDHNHEHDESASTGKLVGAIREQLEVLKNVNATQEQKAFALKFVIHLVGDLHMPFHVGNGVDRGGNACKVLFHNEPVNLHLLWDEKMIDFTKLSFTELALYVFQGRTKEEIKGWRTGDLVDWARESKQLRASIYPENVKPVTEPLSVRQYCRTDITVAKEDMPKLAYDYSYQFMPVVEQRIFQAGLRLAILLNEALK